MKNSIRSRLNTTGVLFVISLLLGGCGPAATELEAVNFTPIDDDGEWPISTPEAEGLDPDAVAELYYNAAQLDNIHGLVIVKNGSIVAEDYFNGSSIADRGNRQSVTKSVTSALVGLALEDGCIESLDEPMLDFFTEHEGKISDGRKYDITIRDMLQMRTGYPWEESSAELFEALYWGDYIPMIVEFPLVTDPGEAFHYSNVTAHLLGVIVSRTCDADVRTYASDRLFDPLGIDIGEWGYARDGYHLGSGGLAWKARDMARFGQTYLDGGIYQGEQLIPADWVSDSWQVYSEDAWTIRVGRNFSDVGYGYLWWAVGDASHRYQLAWGHGGNQIAVLPDHELVIVVTADPLEGQHNSQGWREEKNHLNLVADFIAALPFE